jgi:hypothetical protein
MIVYIKKNSNPPEMARHPKTIEENGEKVIDPDFLINWDQIDDSSDEYNQMFNPDLLLSDLEKTKKQKSCEVDYYFELEMSGIKGSYSPSEILSWDRQDIEAKAVEVEQNASAPLLEAIAVARGVDKSEIKDKVLLNSAEFEVLAGALIGKRQKLQDEIQAANSVESVNSITWL